MGKRQISVGINVTNAEDLPKVGGYLAKFLDRVDIPHGPFDVDIVLSVEPTDATGIGPANIPGTAPIIEFTYVNGPEDFEGESV